MSSWDASGCVVAGGVSQVPNPSIVRYRQPLGQSPRPTFSITTVEEAGGWYATLHDRITGTLLHTTALQVTEELAFDDARDYAATNYFERGFGNEQEE